MSYNIQPLARVLNLGWKNFWRNRWLTLGATLLMTLTLTMISVSLLMTFLLRDSAAQIQSKIDLAIYFRDDTVTDQSINTLGSRIQTQPNVVSVHFVDKTEALQIWNRLPINENIKKPVNSSNNPLPRSLEIKTTTPESLQGVVGEIQTVDAEKLICSECVSYTQNKDTVNRLVSATRFVQLGGLLLSLFFGIIAIFNVMNIIKITISARSDEIEIMRFVGASNTFVRGPFVVEGMMYGLLATVITTLFLLLAAFLATKSLMSSSGALAFFQLINLDLFRYLLNHLWVLIGSQLLIGMILGVIVSLFSLRRYLQA